MRFTIDLFGPLLRYLPWYTFYNVTISWFCGMHWDDDKKSSLSNVELPLCDWFTINLYYTTWSP